jgi:hypothetical protein
LITFAQCMTDAEMLGVPPIDLVNFPLTPGEGVTVYGLGKLTESQSLTAEGYYTEFLQQVTVPYVPPDQCNTMLGSAYTVYDDMICAGGGDQDACQSDSGGPAVVQRDELSLFAGVVSWGVGCARQGKPGVYSSVSAHYDWIKTGVCGHSRTNQNLKLCGGPGIRNAGPSPTPAPTPVPTPPPVSSSGNANASGCRAEYVPCTDMMGTECCSGVCSTKGSPDGGITRVCQPVSSSALPDEGRGRGTGGHGGSGSGTSGRGGGGGGRSLLNNALHWLHQ